MSDFRDDEGLTDNLEDDQSSRVFMILEAAESVNPGDLDLLICLIRILNTASIDDNGLLIEEILSKLEEKYVKTQK